MDLLEPVPSLNLYQPDWPIRTYHGQHPPARMISGFSGHNGQLVDSLLCGGSVISGGRVIHSILSPKVRIDDSAIVEDSILFEGVRVGAGAHLSRCIVDKDIEIPAGIKIGAGLADPFDGFTVSEGGVTVVPKGCFFRE